MKLDPWQREFLEHKGDKCLNCGRQVGKSTICGMDAGEWAVNNKKATVLMIAPTERQAYGLFDKTLDYLVRNYKSYIKRGKDRPTKSKINLNNETTIYCLPTGLSGIGIRFLTVHRLYVDEASRVPREVWSAVTPMLLTTGGDMVLLSTPAGADTYHADVTRNKDSAFNSFKIFEVSSEEVISKRELCQTWTEKQRDKGLEWLKSEGARMSVKEYAQEYEGKIMEDLLQFFPDKIIKACMELKTRTNQAIPGDYFLGVDVARMGGDETVLFSVKKIRNEMITEINKEITTKTITTDTVRLIKNKDRQYNYKKIYIDDGGLGVAVFDPLLEDEQTKRKVIAINNAARSIEYGEKARGKRILKEDLYNNLLRLMEKKKLELEDTPETWQSLRSIQYEYINGKLRIFGNYTHIAEALIRAAWCMKDKTLNIWIT